MGIKKHVATELIRPQTSGLCHSVCHSATCVWNQSSWHWGAPIASAACVAWLGAVADWWSSWPVANTLACLWSCQWRTFWTHLVIINLFSLYLINFMLHIMLDAEGHTLRVHYKCEMWLIHFQGSISTLLGEGGIFMHVYNVSSCLQQCNRRSK